ncbi:type I restriction endonuclease [Shouchella lehensis]|uniref:Restriction endonuclease type I HsdR N-terminal domain-containing protein n=1 Tax=Shouchella lehensis G1 TaxID=1246626 RepID=A0A060M6E0_9BACI|nr:type I restriction endonuclease [Shouchella lehensis]AIC96113.1 hypothetical protein BleG1_3566 [Shouchella lehensis G1]
MEAFIDKIKNLSKRMSTLKDNITTEEATKTSIIMPFFQTLGYDVFNPEEFLPEFIADVGIKKGEKVDFAIMSEGKPLILIEAKSITEALQNHDSQLFRYFGTTSAKFAILTNGISYRFYTDLDEQNKMDSVPFFEFNLAELKESSLSELAKFRKGSFDLDKIFDTASDLKYSNKIKELFDEWWEHPSEEFTSFIVSQVYNGRKTKTVLDNFEVIVKKSFKQYINELVNEKINAALKSTSTPQEQEEPQTLEELPVITEPEIVTTEEEIEGYAIAKMLLKETIDDERVYYRDNKSYFNILLDNSIRKWVCRLYLNGSNKMVQFNDEERTTASLEKISDLENYKEKLIEVVDRFLIKNA